MASLKHSMLGVLLALSLAWLAPAPSHAAGDPRCAVDLTKLPGHELAATLRQLRAFNCDAGKILDQLTAQNLEAWKLLERSASSTADAPELTVTVTGRQYAWRYRYRFQSMGDAATQDKVLACTVVGPLVVPQGNAWNSW